MIEFEQENEESVDYGTGNVELKSYKMDAELNHRPTPKFLARLHPQHWDFVDGELVVMIASKLLSPGLQGVDQQGSYIESKARDENDVGWVYIDPKEFGGVMRTTKVKRGTRHHYPWETLVQVGTISSIDIDRKMLASARRDLAKKYFPDGPHPLVLRNMRHTQNNTLASCYSHNDKKGAARCVANLAELDRIENPPAKKAPAKAKKSDKAES